MRSCPTDDHHFVAFGVRDPPAILRLVKELATGRDGTTRQSVPICVMPGTVEGIPDDLLPGDDQVPVRAGSVRC